MQFGPTLLTVGEGERSESFQLFAESLDPQWVTQALEATGTASVRRRKFPAEYALWTVIGMGLLRDRSIEECVSHLHLVLPGVQGRTHVTSGAVAQARSRLGPEPLAALFEQTANRWATVSADCHRWRDLAVYGVDSTSVRVPDTADNETAFGRPGSQRDKAAYPQVRLVALMVLRTHVLAQLAIGPWKRSEVKLAESLWQSVPNQSLTILDRGFLSYGLLHRLHAAGEQRHWLTRAKKNSKWRRIRKLGPDDELVEVELSPQSRRNDPDLPTTLTLRAIHYQRRGFQPQTLLTSLLDPSLYPANEIVQLYHERWEIELGYDEIKTHTLERQETLRSRSSRKVLQELWGLAIGYNLVRLEMQRVAERAKVEPIRISFRHTLMLIRNFWITAWIASPGVLPKRLDALQEELTLLILPKRRERHYPRAVKIKMSSYPRKR
jgi:Insertion element 4 transposase N-terminal/Transposase DDE domain